MSLKELQRNSAHLYVCTRRRDIEHRGYVYTYISIRSTYVLDLRCVGEGSGDAEGGNEVAGGEGTLVGYEWQLLVSIGFRLLLLHFSCNALRVVSLMVAAS